MSSSLSPSSSRNSKNSETQKNEPCLLATNIPNVASIYKGKVRDLYQVDNNSLILIATDRVSAFDVIMKNGIPGKGKILTKLSLFWFNYTKNICPNHVLTPKIPPLLKKYRNVLRNRSIVVKKLKIIPIEAVVRGFITGGGYREYKQKGSVCGVILPPNLRNGSRLKKPIFTPSTKAKIGFHDQNISKEEARLIVGDVIDKIELLSLQLYEVCNNYALEKGIIIADTKFEFGIDQYNNLVLADEILTPDSSRFWKIEDYKRGKLVSMDKQFIRDYLEKVEFDKKTPIKLPKNIVHGTMNLYKEIYSRIIS